MKIKSAIDLPVKKSLNDPLCLRVEGWLYADARDSQVAGIEIHCNGRILGGTRLRFTRPDVTNALALSPASATGFTLFLSSPELFGEKEVTLECHARFIDGSIEKGAQQTIKLIDHDHRTNHYGVLADPKETKLFHREDIYCTGPSISDANPACLALILQRLGSKPTTVLDVGCGFGAYGHGIRAAGHDWLGVEVKASDCEEMARLGLPHRHVDGGTLPFADGQFDTTICVEVLEHITDPENFLAEIRRVTKRQLLISVPNLELLPYLNRHLAVPWHLLEGDHKNFFTRSSLRTTITQYFPHVEVLCYGRHPLLSPEGIPLYYHLFAHANV